MKMNRYYHYAVYSSRYSAGLGNEIFSFSKTQIANGHFPGTVLFPKYRPRLHELPIEFRVKQNRLYNFRIFIAKIQKKLLIIDSNLYLRTSERIQNWDYSAVLAELVVQNPDKNHLLHCSRMAGGYLAIQSCRDQLIEKISEISDSDDDSLSIALHVRGAVNRKRRFFLFRVKDFSESTDQLTYGEFNKETPLSFYLDAIEFASRHEIFQNMIVKIVTNLSSDNRKIQLIVRNLEEKNFQYRIVNGNQLHCMKAIVNSKLIVPSVSSFSLLAIFLSDSKYLWPAFNLYSRKEMVSIWGFEEYQLERGPTELNRKSLINSQVSEFERIRGLPFPFKGDINVFNWINNTDSLRIMDLIYYGVVPEVFE